MNKKVIFSNKKLTDLYNKIETDLENRGNFLDGISNDIKELEEVLSKAVCPSGLSLEYKAKYFCTVKENLKEYDREIGAIHCGSMTDFISSISWDKSSNGSMRLLYQEEKISYKLYIRSWEDNPSLDAIRRKEEDQIILSKPLIECDAKIRLDIVDFLPVFLEKFANIINSESVPTYGSELSVIGKDNWKESWQQEAKPWHPINQEDSHSNNFINFEEHNYPF